MAEIEFTDDDIERLAAKLRDLDLSDTEKALMNALLGLAARAMAAVPGEGEPSQSSTMQTDVEAGDLPDAGDAVKRSFPPDAESTGPVVFNSVRGWSFPRLPED